MICSDNTLFWVCNIIVFFIQTKKIIIKNYNSTVIDFYQHTLKFSIWNSEKNLCIYRENVSQKFFDKLIFEEIELAKLHSLTYLLHCTDWKTIGNFKALLILLYSISSENRADALIGTEHFTEKYNKRVYMSYLMCEVGFAVQQEG